MLNASIEKLRKEKEQDGLESKEALAQAEAALASSQAAAAALSSQLEEEKERAAAARQAVIDMETRLIDSEKQLVDLTAEMETKLQHERARTEVREGMTKSTEKKTPFPHSRTIHPSNC